MANSSFVERRKSFVHANQRADQQPRKPEQDYKNQQLIEPEEAGKGNCSF
jgi:hypothetical protein